ncbi:efflux RND transporter permease subunit [Antiquaquibacter oligotrophicus]|nr:hypothetical protein [Antiquaquibacter oligotrophicus]UDF12318.1 efflux RND transporter permease subunit [Antiquaquibacter oligotrophicus]
MTHEGEARLARVAPVLIPAIAFVLAIFMAILLGQGNSSQRVGTAVALGLYGTALAVLFIVWRLSWTDARTQRRIIRRSQPNAVVVTVRLPSWTPAATDIALPLYLPYPKRRALVVADADAVRVLPVRATSTPAVSFEWHDLEMLTVDYVEVGKAWSGLALVDTRTGHALVAQPFVSLWWGMMPGYNTDAAAAVNALDRANPDR